jgi:hypothetical protein
VGCQTAEKLVRPGCVSPDTVFLQAHVVEIFPRNNILIINHLSLVIYLIHSLQIEVTREAAMELIFTTITIVGGMSLSLLVALLVEELIFGKVLGLFFVPRGPQGKAAAER